MLITFIRISVIQETTFIRTTFVLARHGQRTVGPATTTKATGASGALRTSAVVPHHSYTYLMCIA